MNIKNKIFISFCFFILVLLIAFNLSSTMVNKFNLSILSTASTNQTNVNLNTEIDNEENTQFNNKQSFNYIKEENLTTLISRIGIDRTAFSQSEKDASSYLATLMTNANLSFYKNQSTFINDFAVNKSKSQNVIGVKKSANANAKDIIIGAHYDNAYSINGEQTKSNGVFDNASGLLCLVAIMNELKDVELPYNIIYIFYGAEEINLSGSKNFVSSLSSLEKKNILFALNFDSIGIGEETFYFSGDSNNAYKKIFKNNLQIEEMPIIRRLNFLSNFENFAYTHIGLMSDNATYLKNGIKCTTFFSGNLSHLGSGYVESVYHKNIMHTQNDNVEYILQTYPNFLTEINKVANLSINVLCSDNLESKITNNSIDIDLFFLNNKIVIIIIFLSGLIILANIKPHKNSKKAII